MIKIISKLRNKIVVYLSHRPELYALIVGVGIVLFWRGVWHSTDLIHTYFNVFNNNLTIDSVSSPWWDGPLSFVVGILVLYITSAFTSSFIGNELILAGLRKEGKIHQKTEIEIKDEEKFIIDIKKELFVITEKIDQLEQEISKK